MLALGELSNVLARPNELDLNEVSVSGVGRFDVFVEGLKLATHSKWKEIQILIEVKVRAPINKQQCAKYMKHIQSKRLTGTLILPVFIAPTNRLLGTPDQLFGDATWIPLSFQDIYDEVIEPSLQHPNISAFGKTTLQEYVKTLKYRQGGNKPLIISQRERDLVAT